MQLVTRTSFITAGRLGRPAQATHEGQVFRSHVQHLQDLSILQAAAVPLLLPVHGCSAVLCMKAAPSHISISAGE